MGEKPAPETASLDDVRARIDAIDDQMLRLVAERAGLASSVAKAKRAAGEHSFGLRPAREAQILRRLLIGKDPAVSSEVVIALWRQIMADSLSRQGAFHISLWGGRNLVRTVELARLRFGAAVAIRGAARPEDAFSAARTLGGVGVLALASDTPWWGKLLAEPKLNVFASLPCLRRWGPAAALAVAQVEVEPSGRDETFWVTDAPQQSTVLIEHLGHIGFAAELLGDAGGLKLFTLAGFVQKDDERLKLAPGRLKGVIGAASMPFDV
ncbi:MAG: Chorismate mutase, type [Caulobacteraceae bacterium]|nr:Chorismate mutase, type [Caulobacteraceae bacterium]